MWNQVGQALSQSMTRMVSKFAALLPGILALIVALILSIPIAWILAGIVRRSLNSIDFDRRVAQWGFPGLADWSPRNSPTILMTRLVAWMVIVTGFLVGISAFDAALTSQLVYRLFDYM